MVSQSQTTETGLITVHHNVKEIHVHAKTLKSSTERRGLFMWLEYQHIKWMQKGRHATGNQRITNFSFQWILLNVINYKQWKPMTGSFQAPPHTQESRKSGIASGKWSTARMWDSPPWFIHVKLLLCFPLGMIVQEKGFHYYRIIFQGFYWEVEP